MSSILAIYILLLVGGLPTILAYKCLQYPVSYIDNGCVVRNLTIRDARNNLITDDYSCDTSVNKQSFNLDWPYNINFTRTIGPEFKHSSFLLVVLDNTSKHLLWMVANITVPPYDSRLTPLSGFYNRPVTIKPYEKAVFDAVHREHQIEFLVFQQRLNFPPYANLVPGELAYHFNLLQWLDAQLVVGNLFCGPVAGAMVRMYDSNTYQHPSSYPGGALYPPLNQPNYNHNYNQGGGNSYPNHPMPPSPPPPYHNSHHKNAAFRFSWNGNLMLSVIVVGVFLRHVGRV